MFSELSGLFDAGYSSAAGGTGGGPVGRKEVEREERRKGRKEERDRWSKRISWFVLSFFNSLFTLIVYLGGEKNADASSSSR